MTGEKQLNTHNRKYVTELLEKSGDVFTPVEDPIASRTFEAFQHVPEVRNFRSKLDYYYAKTAQLVAVLLRQELKYHKDLVIDPRSSADMLKLKGLELRRIIHRNNTEQPIVFDETYTCNGQILFQMTGHAYAMQQAGVVKVQLYSRDSDKPREVCHVVLKTLTADQIELHKGNKVVNPAAASGDAP